MASRSFPEARGAESLRFVATLSSLLVRALKLDNTAREPPPDPCYSCIRIDPPVYALSEHLLNALLDQESSFPSSPDQLLSLIYGHQNTMTLALDMVSLKCLLVYLLKSPRDDDVEMSLCVIMEEPEHLAATGSIQSQTSRSESKNILPLAQRNMLRKLYEMFTDRERVPRIRRIAGKVLTEMLHDSDENCRLFGELTGQNKLRPMLEVLEAPDIVLSFFSSTIIRAMYHSGVGSGPEWELNGPHSRIMHCVQSADSMEQFHLYTCSHHHHTPDRSRSERTNRDLRNCYEVSTDGEHAKELRKGPAILLFDLGEVVLIHCGKDTSGWRTNYLTIMPTKRQSRYMISSDEEKQKRLLSLQVHGDDGFTINDKIQHCQVTLNLEIRSAYDMMKITKQLESVGISRHTKGTRTSPSNRRSSSLVIPWDINEDASSELSEGSHRARWGDGSTNMIEQRDFVPETASEWSSQSSLTELSETPTFGGTSSPRGRDSPCFTGPKPSTKGQQMDEPRHKSGSTAKDLEGREASVSDPGSVQPTEGAASQNEEKMPKDGPTRITRSRSSQNGPQRTTKNGMLVAQKNVLKPIPPNTQESLIFPKRRSRGKLYTAPTKTMMVDWDEDLRASNGSVGPESPQKNELTSVSSPSSSGPGLKLNQSSKQGNRGSGRRRSVAKTKRKPRTGGIKSRKKGKGQAQPKKQVKLLSPALKSIGNHITPSRPSTDGSARKPKSAAKSSKPESENKLSKEQESAKNTAQLPTVTDNMGNCEPAASGPKKAESSNGQSTAQANLDNDQSLSDSHPGRGQIVADKLIAALWESITPRQRLSKKVQSNDMGHGVEAIHEPLVLQTELACGSPQPSYSEHMSGLGDMPDSWTANMSQEVTMIDEMFPVEMYPVDTPDVSQHSSFRDHGNDPNWILGKEDLALIREEAEQDNGRIRRSSSSISSSSAEPRSTTSTFEFYFTGKPPHKKHNGISSNQPKIAASSPAADGVSDGPKGTSKRATTKADNEVTNQAASVHKGFFEDEAGQAAEFQESNTKVTVDKNGSPRVMQQANSAKNEHVTLTRKRQATPPAVQQHSRAKRMRGLNQHGARDITLYAIEKDHAENDASQDGNGSQDTRFTQRDEGCRKDAFGQDVQMTELSTASGVSEATTTRNRKPLPFLDRLQANLKRKELSETSEYSESPSPASIIGRERQTTSNHKPGLSPKRSIAGVVPLKRAEPTQKSVPEPPKSLGATKSGGQMDWQTSLQELHKGMQKTLLSNSEHLSRQIEDERSTINGVLNIYREQCHSVLDQLFEAQKERIRLCKLQMNSIKQQHAIVCQELIRCLEENEQNLEAIGGSQ